MRLPVPATALVGREVEVRAACDLLRAKHDAVRLLSLVGAGGVGKTRLALAVASAVEAHYQDGVAFVDLSALRDPRLLAAVIAHALELTEAGGSSAREVLLEHLHKRQMLVVLDTFEHLESAVLLLTELLEGCPRTALVVTSRTALRVRAERRFQVEPLPEAAAMHLFVERARAVSSAFALTPENISAVAAVCRQLEGIPLAIELAAARTDLLGPQALLRRLERRLPLLTGGGADLPPRQRTLRDELAWSHDLLGPAERTLFRRLAVFEGGWTLEAAEAVSGAPGPAAAEVGESSKATILDLLSSLVGASLVRREQGTQDSSRFRMLDTIREYAEERLAESGEAETIRSRHRDWYLAWAEHAAAELTGPGQAAWYRHLADELDNLRAARAWSRADPHGADSELRLAAALGRYWNVRAPGAEARAWLSDALASGLATPPRARTSALIWSGQMECVHGRADLGEARLREALAVARQQPDQRVLTLALRHLALYCSDTVAAQALLEEAVNVARAAGDWRELALALAFLGIAPEHAGHLAAAERWYTEALAAARASGDATALANVLLRLGGLLLARGEAAGATAYLTEAAATSEGIGYGIYLAEAKRQLAQLALDEGDAALAGRRIRISLEMVRRSGREADALWPIRVAARLIATLGEPARAVQLFAAEATWRARHLSPAVTLWTLSAAPRSDEDLSALRRSLGEQAFATAWATGSALTLDEAVAMALHAEGGGRALAVAAEAAETAALGPEAVPPSNIGPPPVRLRLVPRQRLLEQLDAALAHVVTLIAAPAGFGKTSALVEWEAHVRAHTLVAWVSLTPADTDPARFWRSVLNALQAQHPTVGARAIDCLQARAPVGLLLNALLPDLAGLDGHLALVLDDYHVIQTPAIHAAVAELLSRCPAVFHLVIGTRSDPPLPLARLRANDQLVEIRAADLRFSESEAAELLGTTLGFDLSSEHVAALSARTEGWAAGLQLAALTLRERSDVSAAISSFAGSDRFLVDYFVEEVLARLPSRARAFLERTSILDRLSAPLCDAVVGEPGSGAILEELERANVFITPADNQRTWYCYHQLFAGTLRHRLMRDEPAELVPELHNRACEWYAARGLLDEAIEHALAGQHWDRAADLIGSLIIPLISRGEHLTIERWLTSVPDTVCQRHPVLSGYRAASLFLAAEFAALDTFLARAEPALERAGDDQALGRVLSIHAQHAAVHDDDTVALACARRALSLLPPGPSGYRTTALASIIRSHLQHGDLGQAGHVLEQAIQATRAPSTRPPGGSSETSAPTAVCLKESCTAPPRATTRCSRRLANAQYLPARRLCWAARSWHTNGTASTRSAPTSTTSPRSGNRLAADASSCRSRRSSAAAYCVRKAG